MLEIDPNKCVAYIMENAPKFAQAKAERVFIENYLRTVKSRLMNKEDGTLGNKEAYAYAHVPYDIYPVLDGKAGVIGQDVYGEPVIQAHHLAPRPHFLPLPTVFLMPFSQAPFGHLGHSWRLLW